MNRANSRKGFTLIELLVVIGIIVILSVAVILTLNPAELLRQARDSTRISDLSTIKSALALYLADYSTPDLDGAANINCSAHTSSTASGLLCNAALGTPGIARFMAATAYTVDADLLVDGNGWIPVNLTVISSGSPLPALPMDPVNNATYYYAYRPSGTVYELNGRLESTKYNSGASDQEITDGGNHNDLFEVGTSAGLAL